jgi:hypothetical protein
MHTGEHPRESHAETCAARKEGGARARTKRIKWYVAEYEWFAKEVTQVLCGVGGLEAAVHLADVGMLIQVVFFSQFFCSRKKIVSVCCTLFGVSA